jgi:hypothetical protein
MQFLLLVYTDAELLGKLTEQAFDPEMRQCLQHADEMQARGTLLEFQQLESCTTAKSVRLRGGRATGRRNPRIGNIGRFDWGIPSTRSAVAEPDPRRHSSVATLQVPKADPHR